MVAAHNGGATIRILDWTCFLASFTRRVFVTDTFPFVRGLVMNAITIAIAIKCALVDCKISRALLCASVTMPSMRHLHPHTWVPRIALTVTFVENPMHITFCVLQISQCWIKSEGPYPNQRENAQFVPTTRSKYKSTGSRFIQRENAAPSEVEKTP